MSRAIRLGLIFVLSSLLWFQLIPNVLPVHFERYLADLHGMAAGPHTPLALIGMNVLVLVFLVWGEIRRRMAAPSQRHAVDLLLAARRERVVVRLLIPLSVMAVCGALWWVLFNGGG